MYKHRCKLYLEIFSLEFFFANIIYFDAFKHFKKIRFYNFWYYKDELSCQSPLIGLTAGQAKFESVLTLWGILVTTPVLMHTVGTGKQDIDPKHDFRVANSRRGCNIGSWVGRVALLAWSKIVLFQIFFLLLVGFVGQLHN